MGGWHIQHGLQDRGMVHILGRKSGAARNFIMLLETVDNLKFRNGTFMEFSTYYFWTAVDGK